LPTHLIIFLISNHLFSLICVLEKCWNEISALGECGVRRMCGIKILVFENVLKEMMCMMRIHKMKICKLEIVQIERLCIGRMP
jgi:hypothetical protein